MVREPAEVQWLAVQREGRRSVGAGERGGAEADGGVDAVYDSAVGRDLDAHGVELGLLRRPLLHSATRRHNVQPAGGGDRSPARGGHGGAAGNRGGDRDAPANLEEREGHNRRHRDRRRRPGRATRVGHNTGLQAPIDTR